jgi:nicotinamidase/pyrazinamidase
MSDSTDTKPHVALLLVDPQIDFHEGGSLAVTGALDDAKRAAQLIRSKMHEITEIIITLDSHHRTHIAHGVSWINAAGEHPSPFTLISAEDAEKEVWKASDPTRTTIFKKYARDLEQKGRFKICIWPEHCLIGTQGHAVIPEINDAVQEWCGVNNKKVEYIWKGENLNTEMYSAIAAEVPVEDDPKTGYNELLMKRLNACDAVIICGQALSHCVNFTARDIMGRWKGAKDALIVLTDCSSAVGGFENSATEFVEFCKKEGVHVTTSMEIVGEWSTVIKRRPHQGDSVLWQLMNRFLEVFSVSV